MFELIFEVIGEFLLQIAVEALAEMGLRSLREPFAKAPNPWLAAPGYLVFGAVAGGLSLLVFPSPLVGGGLRLANLLVTPVLAGLAMAWLGAWRVRRGQEVLRLDRFTYGYLFALALALVRFGFAR